PVDSVGRAGTRRRGPEPGQDPPARQSLAARLPAEPRLTRRRRPLLAHERADAGLGDGAGADRAGRAYLSRVAGVQFRASSSRPAGVQGSFSPSRTLVAMSVDARTT